MTAAGEPQVAVSSEVATELEAGLGRLVALQGVRCALLVDRAGRVLARAGDATTVDVVTFAALTAADYGANEQLARLVGEQNFRTLIHHGSSASVQLHGVRTSAVLVTLFDAATPPGLVHRLAEQTAGQMGATLDNMADHAGLEQSAHAALLGGAEEEIDRLFDW